MRSLTFLHILGQGAIGTVYLAELNGEHNFRRRIAVKILHRMDEDSKPFVSRVRDEARLLGLLQDDEILQVNGLEKIQGLDAILMEYVEGLDLSQIIQHRLQLSLRAIATIGAIAAGVLHRAHTATDPKTATPLNVVHRDIKPANIMITKNGGIKICDFGVAKARFEGKESRSMDDNLLGTLVYMDPEYLASGHISPGADIYALGLTLLELITHTKFGRPSGHKREHDQRVWAAIDQARVSIEFANVIREMLQWNPSSRLSGKEVSQQLYKIADNITGTSLRAWAEESVPQLQAQQNHKADPLDLLGKTIQLSSSQSQTHHDAMISQEQSFSMPTQELNISISQGHKNQMKAFTTAQTNILSSNQVQSNTGYDSLSTSPTYKHVQKDVQNHNQPAQNTFLSTLANFNVGWIKIEWAPFIGIAIGFTFFLITLPLYFLF